MAENKDLVELLELKIPAARQQLKDSHKNLGDLATYCERNYIETGQTPVALEETKRYAAQSLASVAYQVNVLAVNMLDLLDKQMKHMGDMEANIHHISQVSPSSLYGSLAGYHGAVTIMARWPCTRGGHSYVHHTNDGQRVGLFWGVA
jgi:hypothetical protein